MSNGNQPKMFPQPAHSLPPFLPPQTFILAYSLFLKIAYQVFGGCLAFQETSFASSGCILIIRDQVNEKQSKGSRKSRSLW